MTPVDLSSKPGEPQFCSACHFSNLAESRFCGGCGRRLDVEPAGPLTLQLRPLCVLYCDLVESTQLCHRLGAEAMRELLASFYRLCDAVVRDFDGHIDQVVGDAIVIYFGYSSSHEDQPIRAVRCALALQQKFKAWRIPGDQGLRVRIGLHRGRFAIGEQANQSDLPTMAVGAASYVAARLQHLAPVGGVVISDSLKRLVAASFQLQPLGVHVLKGLDRAMEAFEVVAEIAAAGEAARLPLPFSGRDQEVSQILSSWQACLDGCGQVLVLVGEAGLGKTRLVQLLREQIESNQHAVLETTCNPSQRDLPFHPFVSLLRCRFALDGVDASEAQARVWRRLDELGIVDPQARTLLADLLSLPAARQPEQRQAASRDPLAWRVATMDLMVEMLRALSRQSPVFLIVEDLHWADPSSLELLGRWMDVMVRERVFFLLTSRHPPDAAWQARDGCTLLPLQRLSLPEAEQLILSSANNKLLPLDLLNQIIINAQGVPLFLIELTRMLIESQPPLLLEHDNTWVQIAPVDLRVIPDSVEDALVARLDQLGPSLAVLQLAATLGDPVAASSLHALWPDRVAEINTAFTRALVLAVMRRDEADASRFVFSHALVRQALYRMMPDSRRSIYHGQIADLLLADPAIRQRLGSEALAYHQFQAGRHREACDSWLNAGRAALARKALGEANLHIGHALEALARLPISPQRQQQEILLLRYRAPLLMALDGWAAPEVGLAYNRLLELYASIEDPAAAFWTRFGLWAHRFVAGQLHDALDLAVNSVQSASSTADASMMLAACNATSYTYCYCGQFEAAIAAAEQGMQLAAPELDLEVASHFHLAPSVPIQAALAKARWMQGQQRQSIAILAAATAAARRLGHAPSVATAIATQVDVACWSRDWPQLLDLVQQLLAIGRRHGMLIWRSYGEMLMAKARFELGQGDSYLDEFLRWATLFRQSGTGFDLPSTAAMIAQAWLRRGQPEKALALCLEAESISERQGIGLMLPELLRTRAAILLAMGRPLQARRCLEYARRCGWQQGARSLLQRLLDDAIRAFPEDPAQALWHRQRQQLLADLDPLPPPCALLPPPGRSSPQACEQSHSGP